ncbi:SART-1 protein [Gongronella butleri]|nr:SART-1 protein [Gongronella butleri]
MAESISLDETNALRAKLGLAPLGCVGDDDDGQQDDQPVDHEAQAVENYRRLKEEREKEAKAQEIRDRIEKSKNRRKQYEKLQGKSIAEMDDDQDDSALAWIARSREKEKQRALQAAKAKQGKQQQQQAYSSTELEGIKVGHAMDEFVEGAETILTIKDRGILDDDADDADMLTNVNLEDKERLVQNLENKKKKPGYNPYADEEAMALGEKPAMLAHYDDERKDTGFVLGKQGLVAPSVAETRFKHQAATGHLSVADKLKQVQTLDYEKQKDIKDYYTQDELTFKKPKKVKKTKKLRKRTAIQEDENDIDSADTITTKDDELPAPVKKPQIAEDANFVDDDDLQAALAISRRQANRQKAKAMKRMTPEEIARAIADENNQANDHDNNNDDDNGLVFSETSEFLSNVGKTPVYIREQKQKMEDQASAAAAPAAATSSTRIEHVPEEEVEQDQDMSTTPPMPPVQDDTLEAVIEEPLVGTGLAATLALLNQKGLVSKANEERLKRDKLVAHHVKWQAEARQQEKLAEAQQQVGSSSSSTRERERRRDYDPERAKEREERERLRQFEERMADYKPDVQLEYVDDQGHEMNTKDAFRFLSHKFHGKTSGKGKTEKRLKKIEEQRKLNNMSSSDTPLNLAGALLERQQQTGNAHVVLSVGNRGVISSDSGIGAKRASNGQNSDRPSKKR